MELNLNRQQEMDEYSRVKKDDYTKEAAVYDAKRFSDSLGRFYADLQCHPARPSPDPKRRKVLDLATGTGRVAVGLAEKGISIFGVDLTWKMLEQARGKAAEKGLRNVSFHVANALDLPYKENTFDKVISIRFFHILPFAMQKAIVREVTRVLKPGGLFVVEFNSPFAGLFLWAVRRDHLVIWPGQVKALFKEMIVIKKAGVLLPGIGRISRIMEIDLLRHKAVRDKVPVDLTSKKFLLLSLLARRAGEVLSRTLIAEQAWDMNFESDSNVVEVAVRRLRRKVDDPFTKKLIHTVRGVGYVLEDRHP